MIGPLIGAAASLGATYLSSRETRRNNDQAQANALRQEALQKEFAQQGISWKVADAKRSGIHPLYALGAQTTAYSPVSVGSSNTDFSGLGKAGQDIGRAIDQTRSAPDRQTAFLQTAAQAAQLEGLKLDNDIKRAELNSRIAVNSTRGPAMPVSGKSGEFDGQGDAIKLAQPSIKLETRRDVSQPGQPSYVAGSGPSVAVVKNAHGGYSVVMPPELAESYESDFLGSLDWQIRNRIAPYTYYAPQPPQGIPHDPETEEVYFRKSTNDYAVRKKYHGKVSSPSRIRSWSPPYRLSR